MSGSKSHTLTFTEELLRKTVTKICQDVGWHRSHLSCLDVISDLLGVYMHSLSQAVGEYANQAGRSEPTADDVKMAFQFMNIDISQLLDLITNVESSPIDNIPLPAYPIAERQNRVLDQVNETENREEWYYPWLPSLDMTKASELQNRIKLNQISQKLATTSDQQQTEENQPNETNGAPIVQDQPQPNGDAIEPTAMEVDSTVASQTDPDKSNKLVLKVSFSKSLDEPETKNEVETAQKDDDQLTRGRSVNVFQRLRSCRAFEDFFQSSLVQNPKMAGNETTVADHDRLPICPLSPGMVQEPDSPSNSNMAQSNMEAGSANAKDNDLKLTKKLKRKISNIFDFDDEHFDANQCTPTIKVKDPGQPSPKTKKKTTAADKDSIKPFSIKVTGFNLLAETPEEAIASMGAMFDPKLDLTMSSTDNFNEATPPGSAKKRKSRPPKEKVVKEKVPKEKKPRKPKLPKTSEKPLSGFFGMDLLAGGGTSLGDDDAAKMANSNSNDGMPFKGHEEDSSSSFMMRSYQDGSDDFFGQSFDGSAHETSGASSKKDPSTPLTGSGSKKAPKPAAKRSKGVHSKKIVKSAEVVVSSDDSSSADEMIGDANPVSLLPLPPEPTLDDILMSEQPQGVNKTGRKRKHSSDSSISTPDSPKHPSSHSLDDISSKLIPSDADESEETLRKKHKKKKKKKKKSKEKHHRSSEEKAERKKQKKEKKEKTKEREKMEKSKEKSFKPKLNIKLKYSDVGIPSPLTAEKVFNDDSIDQLEPGDAFHLDEPFEKKPKKIKISKKKAAMMDDLGQEEEEESMLFMSTKEIKTKAPLLKLSTADSMLVEHAMATTEKKKKKSKGKSFGDLDRSKEEDKKKMKDKSKSDKKKDKEDSKSCKLYRETIDEKGITESEDWACPICNDGHLECDVVCCDNCDKWYHFTCLGIRNGPAENEKWYCPKCAKLSQRKSEKAKLKVKKEKPKVKTAPLGELHIQIPTSPVVMPEVMSPIRSPPKTPGYIPTGRPRGRPRKDSSQGTSRASNSALSPTFDPFALREEEDSFDSHKHHHHHHKHDHHHHHHQHQHHHHQPSSSKKESKKRKDVCPECGSASQDFPTLCCGSCHQLYHFLCVGYSGTVVDNSRWFCASCRRKIEALTKMGSSKSSSKHEGRSSHHSHRSSHSFSHHLSLTDAKFMVATGAPTTLAEKLKEASKKIFQSAFEHDSERCGVCFKKSDDNAETKWIACDDCSKWYHFVCVELVEPPPEDEPWFCQKCVQKQINIVENFKRLRRM